MHWTVSNVSARAYEDSKLGLLVLMSDRHGRPREEAEGPRDWPEVSRLDCVQELGRPGSSLCSLFTEEYLPSIYKALGKQAVPVHSLSESM